MASLDGVISKLRALRLRAGLTQAQVADALAKKGKPGVTVVSRLELGKFANPSLRLVLDYLRACRATAEDAAQLFGQYLAEPLEVPAPIERGPRSRPRGPRRAKEDPAVLEMRREAAVWILRQVVEHFLHHELNRLGAPRFKPLRQDAVRFGRRVFRSLLASRGRPGAVRARQLARNEATAARRGLTPELIRYLETGVRDLFNNMEKEGELDWLPDEERARSVMLRSSRRRIETDWEMCAAEYAFERKRELNEYQKLAGPVIAEAEKLLESCGVKGSELGNYRGFITGLLNIARSTRPGSAERQARLEYLISISIRRWHDPALVRRLAGFVFERWDAASPPAPA